MSAPVARRGILRAFRGAILGPALAIVVMGVFGAADVRAEDYARRNNEGNQLVKEGMLDRAMEKYKEAEIEAPGVPEINYNQANVLNMMGQYDSATTEYRSALATLEGPTAPRALYNLGNTMFRLEQYQLAAESYKRALIANPDDQDAKHNLELALKRLQADSSQQDQQQQDQQQQPDSTDQQQDQQDQKQNQPDSSDQQQPQDNQNQQPDSADGQPPPQSDEGQEPQDEKGQQMPPPQGMTKEDAERLLNALKDKEADVQKKRAIKAAVPMRGKDW